ncbi:MAG: hypothetical protein LBK41_07350 [Clostridiales bacterium]|nr:hypothetical protein [Clostridiales bacterium]
MPIRNGDPRPGGGNRAERDRLQRKVTRAADENPPLFSSSDDRRPYVVVTDSESGRFPIGERLTFAEADRLFKELEAEKREIGGWWKTSATIYYFDDAGNLGEYPLKYDVGFYSGSDSGLLNRVKLYWRNVDERLKSGEYANEFFVNQEKFYGHTPEDAAASRELIAMFEAALGAAPDIPSEPRRGNTYQHQNYRALKRLAPEILDGSARYVRFTAGASMMPLTVERLSGDRIAASHFYEQNGDLMRDPDIEFVIDRESSTLSARTYT